MGHHHGGVGCCCELCGAPAAVHCAADAAFLCAACDAKVHGANFLASRHRRTRLLDLAAAAGAPDEEDGYDSASSSAAPPRRRRRRAPAGSGNPSPRHPPCARRAEAVLEVWTKRTLGLAAGSAAARRRAAAAARELRACAHDLASARVPPRVAMAAALWREVAGRGGGIGVGGHGEALRRLEACAHVPSRLVVAVTTSLERALERARARRRRRAATDAVEGWDECAWAGPKSSPARS
ncbi:unnamed protein product [Miscanthus lutarioriparius]|uniref:B box-type domain-containing protein n=1 Tax=Miscanthus lutarioriparius TaxID=422564 RepID=A0A811SBX7_9POAL|nr:unnamed protein product [Miscanthus lutarioriparius]